MVSFEFLDVNTVTVDPEWAAHLPVCVLPNGTEEHLGWITAPRAAEYDLSIYGAGSEGSARRCTPPRMGYLVTGSDLLTEGRAPGPWPLDRFPYMLETSVPGTFAAGDVRAGSPEAAICGWRTRILGDPTDGHGLLVVGEGVGG